MTLGQLSKMAWREVAWIGRERVTTWRQVAVVTALFAFAYGSLFWAAAPLAQLLEPLASLFGQLLSALVTAAPWSLGLAGLVALAAIILLGARILAALMPLLLVLIAIGAVIGFGIKLVL